MRAQHPVPSPSGDPAISHFGVGIDTSRYGHYAAFLRADLQPAATELPFAESAAGYAQLRQRLAAIAARHDGKVHFHVRLDMAGLYGDNLLHFLHALAMPLPDAGSFGAFTISWGDPQRNKNYRLAIFGNRKSDPIEARAAARFAISERPKAAPVLSRQFRILRQTASRLQAVVRQRTRLINQLHHLLALTFPELALVVKDISVGWVLELCQRYPSAAALAQANADDLANIPYLPHDRVDPLLEHAQNSVASLHDDHMAELVRDQVRQLRDVKARQKRLENALVAAYHALPQPNYSDTIKGIGDVTAAILTAFIIDIARFALPDQLVKYFGAMPIEVASGIDRDGNPRGPKRYVMSRAGNDLVRRYLWMAALSAVQHNPAVRALYARVVAKHPNPKAIAIGHAMRKLLHLVFAVWKSQKPFDAAHYPWDTPAHLTPPTASAPAPSAAPAPSQQEQAAGLRNSAEPVRQEVTAACDPSIPQPAPAGGVFIDFAHLKRQLPLARVLDHLGLTARLRGSGAQKRCACPLHRGDGRGRTFSVNLAENVFHCFDAACQKQGDVIDLWAGLHHQSLRAAALDLIHTFDLEPAPGTEKRKG